MPAADKELRVGVIGDPGALSSVTHDALRGLHAAEVHGLTTPQFAPAAPSCCATGQTYNTSDTLRQLAASKPDVVLVLGDISYAGAPSMPGMPSTRAHMPLTGGPGPTDSCHCCHPALLPLPRPLPVEPNHRAVGLPAAAHQPAAAVGRVGASVRAATGYGAGTVHRRQSRDRETGPAGQCYLPGL